MNSSLQRVNTQLLVFIHDTINFFQLEYRDRAGGFHTRVCYHEEKLQKHY